VVPGSVGEDARRVARDVGDQHAPGLRIVERAAQRHVQAALDDGGAQHLDPALLERRGRNVERIVGRHASLPVWWI